MEQANRSHAAGSGRHRVNLLTPRVCSGCGVTFEASRRTVTLCLKCRAEARKEYYHTYYEDRKDGWNTDRGHPKKGRGRPVGSKNKPKPAKPKKPISTMTLREVDEAARAEGLSYGKFIAKYGSGR